jgi:hypothetical protein
MFVFYILTTFEILWWHQGHKHWFCYKRSHFAFRPLKPANKPSLNIPQLILLGISPVLCCLVLSISSPLVAIGARLPECIAPITTWHFDCYKIMMVLFAKPSIANYLYQFLCSFSHFFVFTLHFSCHNPIYVLCCLITFESVLKAFAISIIICWTST